jgi:uncharacterized protein (UPF0548 family)
MHLTLRKPSPSDIQAFLARQPGHSFSHPHVGATRTAAPPAGWTVDHNRICLGHGPAAWEAARAAIRSWQMFRIGWVEIHGTGAPLAPGLDVAPLAHAFGLWFLNACRVVYLIDENDLIDEPRRFGFAYGTLPDHAESGEERFLVEWREDDSVWYDLLAFSRPGHWLTRLGFPVVRQLQKRFAADSLAAMKNAMQPSARP